MIADVIDIAAKAGALPGQVLMIAGIIILGLVARYQHAENKLNAEMFFARMEAKDVSINKERIDRIAMLMDIIRSDTAAKVELRHAIENNTSAIAELKYALNGGGLTRKHA